jgi:hypothetical protein
MSDKSTDKPTDKPAAEPPPPAQLKPALAAFDRGDFRETRRLLEALLAGNPAADVAAAAQALEARMAPDRAAVGVAMAALGVLALVIGIYI